MRRIHDGLRCRHLIVYCRWPDFVRKSEAFADLLQKRGFQTEICSGISLRMRVRLKSSPDLWIGFWTYVSLDWMPKNYIFVNAEPLNVKRWRDDEDWFEAIRNAKQVWGYTRSNAEYVQKLGVPFRFVPFGYAAYYETVFRKHSEGKKLQQDIDVLFFGTVSERRRRILEELKQRAMNVYVVGRTNPAYGEKLDELLARSKIVLGVHQYDEPEAQIADLARIDHVLSNRLFVVHEKPSASASDPAFENNVTTCEYRDITDTCAHFVTRPDERASRAARAHEWFKSEYALDAVIPYKDVRDLLQQK